MGAQKLLFPDLDKHKSRKDRKRVFYKHIEPVIGGSYTSFNNMLNELNEPNPRKQLDEVEEEMNNL
ncbi:hypothetical protein [Petrimonas sulfuriphila]|uniref:hypothetical protein n=1 Tax=Petrimonas sulfuriphila TaxID=285070 RepID=UPI003EB9D912